MNRLWLLLIVGMVASDRVFAQQQYLPDTYPGEFSAVLQPPSPGGWVIKIPPQQPPANDPQKPDQNPRGAQDSPAFVKVVPPLDGEHKPTKRADEEGEKSSADWWLVKLTGGLIGVGLLQAWVFWVQAGRLKQTISAMKEIDERQSASVAKSIAQATRAASAMEGLALEAVQQRTLMSGQLEAAKTAADATRESVNLIPTFERAYISVTLTKRVDTPPFHFDLSFSNFGKTPGILKEIRICFGVEDLPEVPDYTNGTTAIANNVIAPDAKHHIAASGINAPFHVFNIYGYFTYADIFRETHTTYFALFANMMVIFDSCIGTSVIGGDAYNHYD